MAKLSNRGRWVVRIVLVVLLLVVALPLFYCCGLPLITGQACIDFLSGHVPPRAMDRFLDRLFEATVAEEYAWLATVSSGGALQQLHQVQAKVTTEYEILLGDNLAGMYEYRIRFSNGTVMYLTLSGVWPTCPDFRVTEEEIFENIELSSIHIESE